MVTIIKLGFHCDVNYWGHTESFNRLTNIQNSVSYMPVKIPIPRSKFLSIYLKSICPKVMALLKIPWFYFKNKLDECKKEVFPLGKMSTEVKDIYLCDFDRALGIPILESLLISCSDFPKGRIICKKLALLNRWLNDKIPHNCHKIGCPDMLKKPQNLKVL